MPETTVLQGVRVLEWATIHAGPSCGGILAALGAEVIKLEEPGRGDMSRWVPSGRRGPIRRGPHGQNMFFELFNRGKKSVTVDVRQEEGRDIVQRLVEKSDVFLAGYRLQAAARRGLDYDALKKINPRLIYAHISALGPYGPDAGRPGQDTNGMARGGMMYGMWEHHNPPLSLRGTGDEPAAMCTALGILAALLARERHGISQMVHGSVLGGSVWLGATMLGLRLVTGHDIPAHRQEDPHNPLDNQYMCSDGRWISIIATIRWFREFFQAIGYPHLADDPRYNTQEKLEEHSVELAEFLRGVFAAKTLDEWMDIFRQHDIPADPVNIHADVAEDPQVLANGYVVEYDDPRIGRRMKNMGFPVILEETPANVRRGCPDLGQHTEEVLTGLLGLSPQDVQGLREKKVI